MISLRRLNHTQIALNPDLIERIEETPDTVITLTDGKKILVSEHLDEIIEKIIAFRSLVEARSHVINVVAPPMADLHLVDDESVVSSISPFDENGVR